MDWLALVLILLAALLPGWLLLRWLGGVGDWLELGMAALTLGVVGLGVTAVFLAEIGYFSLPNLAALWLITNALLLSRTHPAPIRNLQATIRTPQSALLLLWLLAAAYLFLRPHELVTGASDAGVYINLGAHIAHSGQLLIEQPDLAALEPEMQTAVLRPIRNPVTDSYLLPALFVTDAAAGEITPQFYALHPALNAVAYGVGGVWAALRLTGVWGILAALAVYLFVRQISGRWPVALLALLGLTINGMQVWFVRYPTSEALTQFLLWAGLWSTAVWLNGRSAPRLWALIAGVALGGLFLVRIDVLFLLPILALVAVWQWRRRQAGWGWFAASLALLVAYSLVHALWQSQPYFYDLYTYAVLSLTGGTTGLVALLLVGSAGLAIFAYGFTPIVALLTRYQRPLLGLAVAALLGLALYAWFIRPYASASITYNDQFGGGQIEKLDQENLLRLGWYLSPLGVWLGMLGICWLVWRVNWQTAVMLLIGLFFTLFYIWQIRNNPVQIYAMRRYMPAVLPLFVVGGAVLIGRIPYGVFRIQSAIRHTEYAIRPDPTEFHTSKTGTAVAALVALLWLGSMGWAARGFVTWVDYASMTAQIAALNDQLEPNSVLLWNDQSPVTLGDQLGAPLWLQYGHSVFVLRQPTAVTDAQLGRTIEQWQNSGRTVYWVGDPTWLVVQERPFTPQPFIISGQIQEAVTTHKPTAVWPFVWELPLARLEE